MRPCGLGAGKHGLEQLWLKRHCSGLFLSGLAKLLSGEGRHRMSLLAQLGSDSLEDTPQPLWAPDSPATWLTWLVPNHDPIPALQEIPEEAGVGIPHAHAAMTGRGLAEHALRLPVVEVESIACPGKVLGKENVG